MCKSRLIQILPHIQILIVFLLFIAPASEFFESWSCGGLDGEMIYISAIVVFAALLLIRGVLSKPTIHGFHAGLLIFCQSIPGAPSQIFPQPLHRSTAILRI
jgi:hypothetical protein